MVYYKYLPKLYNILGVGFKMLVGGFLYVEVGPSTAVMAKNVETAVP